MIRHSAPAAGAALVLAFSLAACQRPDAAKPPAVAPPPAAPAEEAPSVPTDHPTSPETKIISKPMSTPVIPAELTDMQRHVTKENGTEPPFKNEYWDHKEEGIYVSIITGKPLFSSLDKYDSGCGWPSFVKPISESEIKELPDHTHNMIRTEVRTADDTSHLGHVFEDGPPDRGGLRYCINSAAMRFVPKAKMAEAGYGDLLALFEKK